MKSIDRESIAVPFSHYICFTDGSAIPNPGFGGWGALIVKPCGCRYEISGHGKETTNNRMELVAVIESLKSIPHGSQATVITDSTYVSTLYGIRTLKKGKIPNKNADLWEDLMNVMKNHKHIDFKWVKGHAGLIGNERADKIANEAREIGTLDDEPF